MLVATFVIFSIPSAFGHSSCKGSPAGLHAVLFPLLGLDSLLRSLFRKEDFAK